MRIVRGQGGYGTFSWADGFRPSPKAKSPSLVEEARQSARSFLAVITRLFKQGRDDEAEMFWERYADLHT